MVTSRRLSKLIAAAVFAALLLFALPTIAFADDVQDAATGAQDDMTVQAAPYKNKYASYRDAVSAFVSDDRWKPGTPWNDDDNPKAFDDDGFSGCAAYAADYSYVVSGTVCFASSAWKSYDNPSEIQSGDCVRVTLSGGAEHSIVVLSRKGSALETIEGNYDSTVTRTSSRYSVVGNTFYEYGRPCEFEWGDRMPNIYDYDLNCAEFDDGGLHEQIGNAYESWALVEFDEQDTYDTEVYYAGVLLTEGVDYELSFRLGAGDEDYHRTGLIRLKGLNNFANSDALFRFNLYERTNHNYQTYFPEETYPHATVTRLSGNNALDTMKKVVEAGKFKSGGTVVLASVEGYWDALTAAGIAGLEGAPVVMTQGKVLSAQAKSLLQSLKPTRIVVCGGKNTITDAVANAAKAAAGAKGLVRASGNNAAGTAVDIYKRGKGWSDTAIIATAGTYHDALAAAPLAYANAMPIFLADYDWANEKGMLSKATIDAMAKGGIKKAYIAGGTYWISKDVERQLADAGIALVKRLAGASSVETSVAIAEEAVAKYGMTPDGLGLATTASYYDALAGAAFCGKANTVLLLADRPLAASIVDYAWTNTHSIDTAYVFGGTGSVSPETYETFRDAVW